MRWRLLILALSVPEVMTHPVAWGQPLSQAALQHAPCPLVVPADQPETQPLRLTPSQVRLKSRLSCLSPADAVYGPDGCPLRLCTYPGSLELPLQSPRP